MVKIYTFRRGKFKSPTQNLIKLEELKDVATITEQQGQIIYHDGSQWNALNPGTAGQVLKTGGAGANPSWGAIAHADLTGVGADDHHPKLHAADHASGGADAVSLDANQITSGRFGMARMPDGISGYVLTAKGAGVDPAYEAIPEPTIYGYVISDDVLQANDTEKSFDDQAYTKQKEIKINDIYPNKLRITFQLRIDDSTYTVYGRIYRNGVAIGTERSTQSTTYVTFTEDIEGWYANDTVELWGYQNSWVPTSYIQNFRILGKKVKVAVDFENTLT